MGLPPPPAAAAATRAAAVAPAAVAAAALRGLGDLDLDLATIDILTVEARDGLLGVLLARHLHEAEAPRPTGVATGRCILVLPVASFVRDDRARMRYGSERMWLRNR